ncbi:alpha/beta fold hydrolase [Thioalkalicoccus limnaeus]|uniref:Alpha/beta fold hydrolase n=1 Tax=Thioalkalicoccus limnaeus TaxID=120681 RepID=A0ABV4BIV9_9GAMM
MPARRLKSIAWRLAVGLCVGLALAGCESLKTRPPEAAAERIHTALRVLESPRAGPQERAEAVADYQRIVTAVLPDLQANGENPSFSWAPAATPDWLGRDDVAALTPVRRPSETVPGLHRAGLGVPTVGTVDTGDRHAPPTGYRVPVTLLALPEPSDDEHLQMRLADPRRIESVPGMSARLPVAMDLEAPIDATRATGPGFGAGLRYLLRVNRFGGQSRIVFLQPFDPTKTPVVLVHGLMTTPRMWEPVVKALLADPEIHRRYQFWFFYYPTGQPVPLSALQLREALDTAVAEHRPAKPLILVGYSMGGVLSRALVSRVGPDDAERIVADVTQLPESSLTRRALIFEPRTDVDRVVFLFTPHRGSRLAASGLGRFGVRLIRLPEWLRWELAEAVDPNHQGHQGHLPTSIHGLSPRSRFLEALDQTTPAIPVHSVFGNRGRSDPTTCSDGVVSCASAHLAWADSELVVPTGHGGFAHPDTLQELRRILLLGTADDAPVRLSDHLSNRR